MVTVIMGLKGAGKTKHMIDLVNTAVDKELGLVVLIEKGQKLTFDIHHGARLVDSSECDIHGNDMLRGLVAGLHAGNYDISHIFIDSLYKVTGAEDVSETERLLAWLDNFGKNNNIDFTITISADVSNASDKIKSYFA